MPRLSDRGGGAARPGSRLHRRARSSGRRAPPRGGRARVRRLARPWSEASGGAGDEEGYAQKGETSRYCENLRCDTAPVHRTGPGLKQTIGAIERRIMFGAFLRMEELGCSEEHEHVEAGNDEHHHGRCITPGCRKDAEEKD